MRVTVTQLPDIVDEATWSALIEHVSDRQPDLLLLGEMCFSAWLAISKNANDADWTGAVASHDRWIARLGELGVSTVVGTRPVVDDATPYNEGYVWVSSHGYAAAHRKYYLPDEGGFYEATWYRRGPFDFQPVEVSGRMAGFMICTEMWFTEHARAYARAGVDIILVPRATPGGSVDTWLAGGRAAAVMGGAFCLSSNRAGRSGNMAWGALGWIIDPDGAILATTSDDEPFATADIDIDVARAAKTTYPRYVLE